MIAVNFDNDLERRAGEVGEIWANRMLPSELGAKQSAVSQQLPADSFRAAALAP